MNVLNELINKGNFTSGKLYLLYKISNDFGFFYQDKIVYFAKKSTPGSVNRSVNTSCLDMNLCVHIISDNEDSSFETGNYDLLAYKGIIEGMEFDVFYNICVSYANDSSDLEFSEFFSSLVELFKKDKDNAYTNVIGTIGELLFIKKVYEDYEIDISNSWHISGNNSKFDFSFPNFNIEVKTSEKNEMKFLLKHSQIFNNQKNYIAVISIIETGNGESLDKLFNYFINTEPFKNNVSFQILMQKELLKSPSKKSREREFSLDLISIYDCDLMTTIQNIPSCITNVQYEYNFSDLDPIDLGDIFR